MASSDAGAAKDAAKHIMVLAKVVAQSIKDRDEAERIWARGARKK
jgi:hypothetical protein